MNEITEPDVKAGPGRFSPNLQYTVLFTLKGVMP